MTSEGVGASHGSRIMTNSEGFGLLAVGRVVGAERNVRRKDASPFSCLMVTDILTVSQFATLGGQVQRESSVRAPCEVLDIGLLCMATDICLS